jgi:dTDP-glucose 4,6-dehydratase
MDNPLAQDLDHVLDHTRALWEDVRGERLFITGGTGFVGTWLTESLLWANRRLGLEISAFLLTRSPERFRHRSPHLAGDRAVTLLQGDGASFEFPGGAFPLVIHAATERWFDPQPGQESGIFDCDLAATRRVLELAKAGGTRRLLFTSSGAVYGKQPAGLEQIPEDYPGAPSTMDPKAAYGQGKRAAEFLCASYAQVCRFDSVIARLFAFTGPYLPLDEGYAAGNFLRDILQGGPIRIAGDGTPYRSYLYAADLAIWVWTLLMRGRSAYPYNVGSPEAVTIRELAERMADAIAPGTPVEIARQPVEGAPPLRYVPSTERARVELGLETWVGLEEGIRRSCAWHRRMQAAGC